VNTISLQNAFESYFHDKRLFTDFIDFDVTSEYKEIFYSKNTFSPSKELKQYQQFLNFFIFDFMQVNTNVVFSYRKGVSVYDAVSPHKNSKYILTTDIRSFFLHISAKKIKELIINNKQNFLIFSEDIEKYIDIIVKLVTFNNILPIGAPTSPKISNAYLYNLDNKLEAYCQEKKIIYTRYSDDFIFSSNNKDSLSELLEVLKQELKVLKYDNLELNDKKTKIQKQGSRVVVLGLVITPNGNITIDKNIKKDIEVLLHFYLNDKDKFKDFYQKVYGSDLKIALEKVSGRLSYIKSIDKNFILKLKKKYGSYIVNSFIHRDIDE